jgi:putative ABC transport system permease protein
MELRTSLNRFLSIFLIVALGVAFFAGLRATNPDMRLTADNYYDASNLMDIRVLGSMGLIDEDVEAIRQVTGVRDAEAAYSTHVVCDTDESELVLEVMSVTERLNKIVLTEGRMPQKKDEAIADEFLLRDTGYQIGDKIKISSGTKEKLTDTLGEDEFTIVGVGSTSYYLSFQRGSSNIGNGDVNSFIAVLPEAFTQEAYTTVYVMAEGAREEVCYTEEYNTKVATVLDHIEAIAEEQCKKRYASVYDPAYQKLMSSKDELLTARTKAEEELKEKQNQLAYAGLSEEELSVARQKLDAAAKETSERFDQAEEEIKASEEELNKLELPKWYVLDRGSIEAYMEYEQNADRIGAIGKVFPAIFFLVAALISLTTMTRMVEEERIEIGTLKGLGYSKLSIARKYLLYAFLATLGGSLFGAAVGLKVLPTIIITAYKIMYPNIPNIIAPFNLYYASLATILAVMCVELATFFSCYRELYEKPAQLMRPVAPKAGKRVFLERISFLWRPLNFTWKATIRNLIRYKKRFFMTIFGIGGCMALLLVGFGLMDSIFVIYSRQFEQIMTYDAIVAVEGKATEEQLQALEEELTGNESIKASTKIMDTTIELNFGGRTKNLTMYVPEDKNALKNYIVFRTRVGHDSLTLEDDGVILTEQIAKNLGIHPGDTVSIKEEDKEVQVKVTSITENYMTHYLYLSSDYYRTLFGKAPDYNEYLVNLYDNSEQVELKVGNALLDQPATAGVFYTSYYHDLMTNILTSLNIVVWVLIISAGALAFVVLYNLNNININERRRELATIRVLGFYNNELAAYVYRENIILTMIGTLVGIGFGILLHRYVITTVEIDLVMFGRNIDPSSYVYSILLTFLFSAIVNFVMYFKLKKINMVESLKNVE